MILANHLHMPSYCLKTFTECPNEGSVFVGIEPSFFFGIRFMRNYNPFFLASFQMASISSRVMAFRFLPSLMVCSSR